MQHWRETRSAVASYSPGLYFMVPALKQHAGLTGLMIGRVVRYNNMAPCPTVTVRAAGLSPVCGARAATPCR